MTTEAEQIAHFSKWSAKGYAVFNPNELAIESLPVIYGFNNGGSPGWYTGVLLAEDGASLGDHLCSHEGYMLSDLGILEGSRPDRHEEFQKHYPNGYKMDFVSYEDCAGHDGLNSAIKASEAILSELEKERT